MKDKKIMKGLRTKVMGVNVILMCITLVLHIWAFEALRQAILCSCILLLIAVTLVFDGILKDGKGMATQGGWFVLWLYNLIIILL